MWAAVQSRLHDPIKIFPFGSNASEVMLHGTVQFVLKDGRKATVPWAARAELVKEGSEYQMSFYQVFMVRIDASGFRNTYTEEECS